MITTTIKIKIKINKIKIKLIITLTITVASTIIIVMPMWQNMTISVTSCLISTVHEPRMNNVQQTTATGDNNQKYNISNELLN